MEEVLPRSPQGGTFNWNFSSKEILFRKQSEQIFSRFRLAAHSKSYIGVSKIQVPLKLSLKDDKLKRNRRQPHYSRFPPFAGSNCSRSTKKSSKILNNFTSTRKVFIGLVSGSRA